MKRLGIKASILVSALAALVAGIILMVVIIGSLSFSTTSDMTQRLVEARVNEYTNEFRAVARDAYGAITSVAPIVENMWQTSETPRDDIMAVLEGALEGGDSMIGIWTCWEPNALDGKDSEYVNKLYHDSTGRYIPYLMKDSGRIKIEPFAGYETAEYYLGARNSGKPYVTDPYRYTVAGQEMWLYTIALPILKNGNVVGVVGTDINLDEVVTIMNRGSILNDGYIYTLSPGGFVATHPNTDTLGNDYRATWMNNYRDSIDSALQNGGDISMIAYSDQAQTDMEFLGHAVMIGDTGRYWLVCGVVPVSTVNSSSMALLWIVIGVGVALIGAVGAIIFLSVNGIAKRLEFAATELSEATISIVSAADELAAGSDSIANGGTEQAASIEETSATMNETASMVRQTTENTRKATELTAAAEQSARQGGDQVTTLIESMGELSRSSDEIQKIIKTIDNIAFQTNILAINAAVESARAGDAGKGFMVVAEEVRSLAQQSADAAKSTAEIIETNIELSRQGMANSQKVGESFREIAHETSSVNAIVDEINTATAEQERGVSQISIALSQLEKVTQSNAAVAEESAAAAAELRAQSQALGNLAHELNVIVKGANAVEEKN